MTYSIYNKKQRRIIRCFNSYKEAEDYMTFAPEESQIIQTDELFKSLMTK